MQLDVLPVLSVHLDTGLIVANGHHEGMHEKVSDCPFLCTWNVLVTMDIKYNKSILYF